jgi:hypothetical protein
MNELYDSVLFELEQQPEEGADSKRLEAFVEHLHSKVLVLESYYTSGDWLADFEADEAGLLPKDLKRGVLSEDGLHDLLDAFKEFEQQWENPQPIEEVYGPPEWFR